MPLRLAAVTAATAMLLGTDVFAAGEPLLPGWQPPGIHAELGKQPKYVVLLILDGGLPSYLSLGAFPNLASLAAQGVTYSRAFDGMLETETPTGHATLGTGSLPRRHGVISFSWYTDRGVEEHPTNPIPIQQGQLEQILRRSGAPSIASLLKQHDPTATVAVTSGHKDYAVDSVGGWAADYLMYYAEHNQIWAPVAIPRHVPPKPVMSAPGLTAFAPHLGPGDQDHLAVQLALSAFRELRPRITIVNLPEFDWPLGHLMGGLANSWMAWRLMEQLDSDIGQIKAEFAHAHLLSQTLFVVTADHGMLTLNHAIPHELIQKVVENAGTSLVHYEYHSAGYLWLKDSRKAGRAAGGLVALQNPLISAVYYRKPHSFQYLRAGPAIEPAGAAMDSTFQFLLSTLAGPNAPHVVAFLRENTAIIGRNEIGWRGDHGGASWNAEHVPLLISGPGIRHDVISNYPATIYDIAPTVLSLLGVEPRGMDGVVLSDALLNPAAGLEALQAQRGARLEPVVQALIGQSARDGP